MKPGIESAQGTHPEDGMTERPMTLKDKALVLTIFAGAAAAFAAAISAPEPETRTFGARNIRACEDVPEGVDNIAQYRESCRALVAACAEQAGILKDLSAVMSDGTEGPNADSVIGLQDEATRLRVVMETAIDGMDQASKGRKPEKIVCQNEGPNEKRPLVDRTSRRWVRRSQNR